MTLLKCMLKLKAQKRRSKVDEVAGEAVVVGVGEEVRMCDLSNGLLLPTHPDSLLCVLCQSRSRRKRWEGTRISQN